MALERGTGGGMRKLGYKVFLPQERAWPMLNGREEFNPPTLFSENIDAISQADVVLAVLDGADSDSGTCWECGYAYGLGRPVIGLRTDIRKGGDEPRHGVNLMLSYGCQEVIAVPLAGRDDTSWLTARVEEAIRAMVSHAKRRKTSEGSVG